MVDTEEVKEITRMIATTSVEHDLAAQWATGDRSAFTAIVERYGPMVHARCARSLPPAEADDATQAVFLVLLKRPPQAAAAPRLAAWLLRVADNVVRNAHRDRRRRLARHRPLAVEPTAAVDEEEGMDMDALGPLLDAAMAELPARERRAPELHIVAGHSYAEIGAATGTAASTVASRVTRGLERLRGRLGARGVTVTALALGAALAPAGEAAVLATIRSWDPSAVGAGATATAPTTQALRWSSGSFPIMQTVTFGIGAAALASLILVPALIAGGSPEPAEVPPDPAPVVDADPAADDGPIPGYLDPRSYHVAVVYRLPDPQRSWRRLQALPEMGLLPEALHAQIAAEVADMGPSWLALDLFSSFGGEDMERMAAEAAEAFRVRDEDRLAQIRASMEEQAVTAGEVSTGVPMVRGEVEFDGDLTTRRASMEAALEQMMPMLGVPLKDGSWRLEEDGPRLALAVDSAFDHSWSWAREELTEAHRDPDADVELVALYKRKDGTGPIGFATRTSVAVDDGRLALDMRLSSEIAGESGLLSDEDLGSVSPAALSHLPADTLAAYTLPLRRGSLSRLQSLGGLVNMAPDFADESKRAMRAAYLDALLAADGPLVLALRGGGVVPSVGVELPTTREAAVTLIAACAELAELGPQDDPEQVSVTLGQFQVHLAWTSRGLVGTTHIGGVEGWLAGDGSFLEQPEVIAARAELPAESGVHLGFVRSGALVQQLSPLAYAALPQEDGQRLLHVQQALAAESSAGWIHGHQSESGTSIQARGTLAVVLGAAMAGMVDGGLDALSGSN